MFSSTLPSSISCQFDDPKVAKAFADYIGELKYAK